MERLSLKNMKSCQQISDPIICVFFLISQSICYVSIEISLPDLLLTEKRLTAVRPDLSD